LVYISLKKEGENMITQVKKRDGSIVLFNKNKIADAIFKAAKSVGGRDREKSVLRPCANC
jgi:anaerobic ribonucleoside-triphosphate reductase